VPIFLDNLKFFRLHFLRKSKSYLRKCNLVFLASELDSESLSTLRKIIFKREASRVEGYVTPSCTRNEAKCQNLRNLRKFEKYLRKFEKYLRKFEKLLKFS